MTDETMQRLDDIEYTGRLTRSMSVDRAQDADDPNIVRLAFSSEFPVLRYFGEEAYEVLDHDPSSVRLDRMLDGGPVLVDHRNSVDSLVASVVSISIDADRVGRAVVRMDPDDEAAQRVLKKVRNGTIRNISFAYDVHRLVLDRESDGEIPTYRSDDWEVYEISFVAVPADPTVGVDRIASRGSASQRDKTPTKRIQVYRTAPSEGAETEPASPGTDPISETRIMTDISTTDTTTAPAIDVGAELAALRKAEDRRVREIRAAMASYPEHADYCQRAMSDGTDIEAFQSGILTMIAEARAKSAPPPDPAIGMSAHEQQRFSFCRFVLATSPDSSARDKDAGAFELEVSGEATALARSTGARVDGAIVPIDVLRAPDVRIARAAQQRAIETTSTAGNLVATDLLSASFIDILRNQAFVFSAGAIMLPGLVGNVAIPRKLTGSAVTWLATEATDAGTSEPTFGQVTLSPKGAAVHSSYSRNTLLQATPEIEGLIRFEHASSLAVAIDLACLYGSGASGQPTGITQTAGINAPTAFAAAMPTYAELVAMETAVAVDNAVMAQAMAYFIEPTVRGHAKTTPKLSGGDREIWEPGNTLNGYAAYVTNQVTTEDVFFGHWMDLVVGMWGGLDVISEPYTGAKAGVINVTSHQSIDVGVRHPVSFAYNNDGV